LDRLQLVRKYKRTYCQQSDQVRYTPKYWHWLYVQAAIDNAMPKAEIDNPRIIV